MSSLSFKLNSTDSDMLQSENSALILNLFYQTFTVLIDFINFSQTLNLGWHIHIYSELIFSSYQNYFYFLHAESIHLSAISPGPFNKNTNNDTFLLE